MKIVISIPDKVFEAAERAATKLGMSTNRAPETPKNKLYLSP